MAYRPDILDVRIHNAPGANSHETLAQLVIQGLLKPAGSRTLPTMLLYDERGLRLYDDITTEAPEYYLFGAEEDILKNYADEIVQIMHSGTQGKVNTDEVVVELGAGSLRKTSHLLLGLAHLVPTPCTKAPITYYALDLEERELARTLEHIASEHGTALHGKVDAKGMWGTYEGGIKFIEEGGLHYNPTIDRISESGSIEFETMLGDDSPASSTASASDAIYVELSPVTTPDTVRPPLHIFFLGSSLGNFSQKESAEFLRSLPLMPGSGDTLLLGLDHDNEKELIEVAYNDPKGYTEKFIMNGLRVAGRVLGNENLFDEGNWEYVNTYNKQERRHEAFFKSKCAQVIVEPVNKQEVQFQPGELLQIEVSHKFSDRDAFTIFTSANLRPIQRWMDSTSRYSLWLLERPPLIFPLLPSSNTTFPVENKSVYPCTPFGVPSPEHWEDLWTLWDLVTRRMIPPAMVFQKPIDLRHICLFYFGHIPTFLDIHLSRLLGEPNTPPEEFKYIFERGIDPNVDDPTECHPHSEVPARDEDWPALDSILQFQTSVRARLLQLYEDIDTGKKVLNRSVGRVLAMAFEHEAMHAETLLYMLLQRAGTGTIPPAGFTPPPWASLATSWDSSPQPPSSTIRLGPATVSVGHNDFEADDVNPEKALSLHDFEYGWDNEHPKKEVHVNEFRIEWRPVTNGQFYKFYMGEGQGKVQFPASWVEQGGEVMVRTMYGPVPMKIAHHWPIMTSYDNLSTYASVQGGRIPTEPELLLFRDKFESGYEGGANLGFRNWHPVPATTGLEGNGGRGHNGGVWEWTSTLFDKCDGFIPSTLYPAYSQDFFDGNHQVVIGGSFATIPRFAERRSVRNWYQRNYPYMWVGARIAYDIEE